MGRCSAHLVLILIESKNERAYRTQDSLPDRKCDKAAECIKVVYKTRGESTSATGLIRTISSVAANAEGSIGTFGDGNRVRKCGVGLG